MYDKYYVMVICGVFIIAGIWSIVSAVRSYNDYKNKKDQRDKASEASNSYESFKLLLGLGIAFIVLPAAAMYFSYTSDNTKKVSNILSSSPSPTTSPMSSNSVYYF